jgi:hypothetical protein
MSDVQTSVLCPFSNIEFLKRDPQLNGVPIPGLLYADDLVLFCLSADLLRVRLKLLEDYAFRNTLTVNVKCEVVIFGKSAYQNSFQYNREIIPIRRSCKYLGVWLDGALSGKALADAIVQKFKAAIPVFFGLCRRLRLARLDLVYRLANSLVFSVLYGSEFLTRYDVLETCEQAWWNGVRRFYGLPNGVSSVFIKLMFPRVRIHDRVILSKFSLLFRGAQPSDTLFLEAVIYDRGYLLAQRRVGFSQTLKEWCQFSGPHSAFSARDMTEVCSVIAASREHRRDAEWATFASMASTGFVASLLSSPAAVYSLMLEFSRFGSLGVRVGALALTGALTTSYNKTRLCFCGTKFIFTHFHSCSALDPCRTQSFRVAVECEDWREAASIVLGRFEVYLHTTHGGHLPAEESQLFDLLNAVTVGSDDEGVGISKLH